jgi:hypothetical protein
MALVYAPTSEIEAVNNMLQSIGETPVNTLPTAGVTDASIARDVLHRINRQVQGMGLKFNSDYEVQYTPDIDGFINIPSNALRVSAYYYMSVDYAVRDRKLYDRENQTNVFTSSVKLNIVTFLPWDDMPEHVRQYVYVKASRRFQAESVGSQNLWKFSQMDEAETRAEMMRWELIKHSDTILASPGIYNTVNRRA